MNLKIFYSFFFQPIDRNFRAVAEGDALSGRVKYRGQDRSEKEVQFGETDQVIKSLIRFIFKNIEIPLQIIILLLSLFRLEISLSSTETGSNLSSLLTGATSTPVQLKSNSWMNPSRFVLFKKF